MAAKRKIHAYEMCKQKRLGPVCVSVQSDLCFCCLQTPCTCLRNLQAYTKQSLFTDYTISQTGLSQSSMQICYEIFLCISDSSEQESVGFHMNCHIRILPHLQKHYL